MGLSCVEIVGSQTFISKQEQTHPVTECHQDAERTTHCLFPLSRSSPSSSCNSKSGGHLQQIFSRSLGRPLRVITPHPSPVQFTSVAEGKPEAIDEKTGVQTRMSEAGRNSAVAEPWSIRAFIARRRHDDSVTVQTIRQDDGCVERAA